VKVFFDDVFSEVAGSVHNAYGLVSVVDRDGQRATPAGIGAGLRKPPMTCHHEGRLGRGERELYGRSVRLGKLAGRIGRCSCGGLRDSREVFGPYKADPVRLKLFSGLCSDHLRRSIGVEVDVDCMR